MPIKRPFKTRIYEMLNDINKEIKYLENTIKNHEINVDYKVVTIKLNCLLQHKRDIEELISLCVDRNRF